MRIVIATLLAALPLAAQTPQVSFDDFLVGLRTEAAAKGISKITIDAALTGIAELITAAGGKSTLGPCADAPGQQCLEIAIESPQETPQAGMPGLMGATPAALVESPDAFGVYLTLHAVRVGDTLVLATTAPDAARRTRPDFVSAPWPQALAGAGASGLSVPGFASFSCLCVSAAAKLPLTQYLIYY